LATVKIITRWVNPEAYGHASLLLGIVAVLNGMLAGPLMVAHLRLYFDYLNRHAGQWYIDTFQKIFLALGSSAAVTYLAFAAFTLWCGEPIFLKHVAAVFVILLSQPFFSARSNYLEAHRQQGRLAVMNVLQRGGQPCILIALLALSLPAVDAILLGQGLTTLLLVSAMRAPRPSTDSMATPESKTMELRPLLREIGEFGWTLPITFLAMWLLTTGDRYLLEHFKTSADVGRYAMNYGLWSMPYVFLNGWLEILTRPLIFDAAARGDWMRVKKVVAYRIGFGLLASVAGIIVLIGLSRFIASYMLSDRYWIGIPFVKTITGAHSFYVLGYSIVPIFIAAKRMTVVFFATACAALANLGINWFVIPSYGMMGAAKATLYAYILWATILAVAGFILIKEWPEPTGEAHAA
jgi:O-antigen/teichoic acid export membrane protein